MAEKILSYSRDIVHQGVMNSLAYPTVPRVRTRRGHNVGNVRLEPAR